MTLSILAIVILIVICVVSGFFFYLRPIREAGDGYSEEFISRYPDASITVVTPNGGELFTAGKNVEIKWKTENVPVDAEIDLIINDLVFNTTNTGSYSALIPSNFPGGNYKVKAAVYDSPVHDFTIFDLSDGTFTVSNKTGKCFESFPSLSLSLDRKSPKGRVLAGSKNVELARFKLTPSKNCNHLVITRLDIVDDGSRIESNLKIYDENSNMIAIGKSDGYFQFSFYFPNSALVLAGNTAKTLVVKGDVQKDGYDRILAQNSTPHIMLNLAVGDWLEEESGATDQDSNVSLNNYNIATTGINKAKIESNSLVVGSGNWSKLSEKIADGIWSAWSRTINYVKNL